MARKRNLPAVPEPERLPWERQKGETMGSFGVFALYRDLGPHRSLSKVAADSTRSIDALKKLSAKHGWVERAEAYDDHVDRRLREERETERIRIDRVHMGLGASMVGLALRRINGSPAAMSAAGEPVEAVEAINPNEMDFGDVARIAEVGMRTQRVAAGMPTDLIRGVTQVNPTEAVKMADDLVRLAMKFIPVERQQRFYTELAAYLDSGRVA